jgi:hypothetical protein
MARGGARPGAGRKPGTPGQKGPKPITKARKAVAEKILVDGDLTPLEVMIDAMRDAHTNGDMRSAAMFANMAAPYVHPRLSTVNANQTVQGGISVTLVSEFPDE